MSKTKPELERKIYLVRHGQASLGAADYDNLSPLGEQQAKRLGAYFSAQGITFDAVYAGTLRRHAQTLSHMALGGLTLPPATLCPGLNEYDSEQVIAAICTPQELAALASPTTGEGYKQHFVRLRKGIGAWMRGESRPANMSTYAQFAADVMVVLDAIRASQAQQVLIASSGGPLSSALAQVLGLAHEAGIELNMRMRNTAVSELIVTPKRCAVLTYNTLPHLDAVADRALQTYA